MAELIVHFLSMQASELYTYNKVRAKKKAETFSAEKEDFSAERETFSEKSSLKAW